MIISIRARRTRKRDRIAITFEINAATWANMGRSAKGGAHPDTLDYIAGTINMAFVDDWSESREVAAKSGGAEF